MKHNVIILCGGEINQSNLPIATSVSNAMIPVNGKPVIGWILDDLQQKGVERTVIVTQAHNRQLINFVEWAFKGRLNVELALLTQKGSIIHSLQTGLQKIPMDGTATVILGDTLITGSFPDAADYVLVSENYEDPQNWCLADTDDAGWIRQYFDKSTVRQPGLTALVGFYHFSSAAQLATSCQDALQEDARELSNVLTRYGKQHPIRAIHTTQWYDFGHIAHFLAAKRALLQSRYFNQLSIDEVRGVVRKSSRKIEKLTDEYNWYLLLPDELKVLTPRLLNYSNDGKTCTLEQEYYGYPNLAELYLYGHFDLEIWKMAIRNLMQTHAWLRAFRGLVSKADAREMYWGKTKIRIQELASEDDFFNDLIRFTHLTVNGQTLENLPQLEHFIREGCERISLNVRGSVIHGDYCLSNILYDVNNQLVRLIDPRGSFGKKGIYGDPRYDMAKLRHSLSGAYDFIVADLFSIQIATTNTFETAICRGEFYDRIADFFDAELERQDYNIAEIKFIEGLLFLSMIPLHKDKPQRQIMMYLRAITLFNQLKNK